VAQTFNVAEVSYGIVGRREPRITEIKFDDGGYSLRMKKGFNSDLQVWDVPINAISISGANAVEAFLAEHGGVNWFWWTAPRQTTARKFICKRWTREPVSGSRTHDKMTLSFEEVVDIAG
jgi:phage-related protein